jgi:uncharacterized membrane protein SpoIIM required for sporulation
MDYGRFLHLRRPVWEAFGRGLDALRRLPDTRTSLALGGEGAMGYEEVEALAIGYRQVLHDHALATTRFPGTGAARQLADLSLQGTHALTRRSRPRHGLRHFVFEAFPGAFRRQLGMLGLVVAVFGVATLFGLILAAVQPGLGSLVLGPEKLHQLEEGHLWTEMLTRTPTAIGSSQIFINNIKVALVAWSGGILAGIVPIYTVLANGLILGFGISVTLHYSMAADLLAFTAAHGPLEITLILVCSAAGLSLGSAVVGAGDVPRAVAMQRAAGDSLCVMLGCLPWFVVLGVVEARISPDPSVPLAVKIALGVSLVLVFLGAALGPHAPTPPEASDVDPV